MVRLSATRHRCRASGNDPIRFRNGLLFAPDDRQVRIDPLSPMKYYVSLYIHNISKHEHAVNYRLQVTNRFGQSSANASLNIPCNSSRVLLRTIGKFFFCLDEPSFLQAPVNQTVRQGSSVYLEATIDGNPAPDVFLTWEAWPRKLPFVSSENNSFLYRYVVQNIQSHRRQSVTFHVLSTYFSINISRTAFIDVLGREVDYVGEWTS